MINFVPVLANILKKAMQKNEEDPQVTTAEPVVFEELKKKFEGIEPMQTETKEDDILEMMKRRVEDAKVENEVNPEVETADGSIYSGILKELEKLRNQANQPTSGNQAPTSQPSWDPPVKNKVVQAMTNSGGSLQLRQNPDMGAPIHQTVRIPDNTILTPLQYSENTIILDGKKSRFALVEYNGVRGWILESYLNFN